MDKLILESIYEDTCDVLKTKSDADVVIYGSAKEGCDIKKFFESKGLEIAYFITSWDELAGIEVEGKRLISIKNFRTLYQNCVIVLASSKVQHQMFFELKKIGVSSNDIVPYPYIDDNKEYHNCICCEKRIKYKSMPELYFEMQKKFGYKTDQINAETCNHKEYNCPVCTSTDRDRLIIAFLQKIGLQFEKNKRLLQFAPARSLEYWIKQNCVNMLYESADLYAEDVSFKVDIQNMSMIKNDYYDYFICSHVLEHVQDDRIAMKELFRILKDDGIGIVLVPINLTRTETDEKWGLSEAENWRRFGQGDHCRSYAKKDFMQRLESVGFCVHQLGVDYFGADVFEENGLLEESILYVLTKNVNQQVVIV